jgi:hypothetical protein
MSRKATIGSTKLNKISQIIQRRLLEVTAGPLAPLALEAATWIGHI